MGPKCLICNKVLTKTISPVLGTPWYDCTSCGKSMEQLIEEHSKEGGQSKLNKEINEEVEWSKRSQEVIKKTRDAVKDSKRVIKNSKRVVSYNRRRLGNRNVPPLTMQELNDEISRLYHYISSEMCEHDLMF